jgi:starch synthase (maltosyl-transferring)
MPELGLSWGDDFMVRDHITGTTWRWSEHTFAKLNPAENVAHIVKIMTEVKPLEVFAEPHSPQKGSKTP